MSYSAFIVDDEVMARGNLLDALKRHPRWSRLRVFGSGEGLIKAVDDDRPDAVFLDVQMPGADGVVLAQQLLQRPQPPLIIFVTAFAQYAVAAFELYAVDYLLKPFDDARLDQCVARLEQALARSAIFSERQAAQAAWANTSVVQRLVIKSTTSVRIIEVGAIDWIAANGNYVDIHHSDGKHLLRASLRQVRASLPSDDFVQIHRGYVVRVSLIREIRTVDVDRVQAVLATGEQLPVGKSFKSALMSRIGANP